MDPTSRSSDEVSEDLALSEDDLDDNEEDELLGARGDAGRNDELLPRALFSDDASSSSLSEGSLTDARLSVGIV